MNTIDNPFTNLHIPRWNELPNIDLYLDQVVCFVNSSLLPFLRPNQPKDSEEVILSKTMINNYVKNNIIEAPVKKKYGRIQVAKLIVICVLKQVYSINDIKSLIKISTEHFAIEQAYNSFCHFYQEALTSTFEKKEHIDTNKELDDDRYLLKSVLLSCSYKSYTEYILSKLSE